jgi:hypothetical protein
MLINEAAAGSAGPFLQVQRDYARSDGDFLAQLKD